MKTAHRMRKKITPSHSLYEQLNLAFILCLISTCLICFSASAHNIDVYGTTTDRADVILEKYGLQIENLSNLLYSNINSNFNEHMQNENMIDAYMLNKSQLIDRIQQEEGYLWADIAIIYYDREKIYTTVDVVEPRDQHRLNYFRSAPTDSILIPDGLMQLWDEYEKTGLDLFFEGKLITQSNNCPVWHCLYGFEHPQLARFEKPITEIAREQSDLLRKIINADQNPKNRASAIYLMGHLADPDFIIQSLVPLIYDPDPMVRNNAMRVIGSILERYAIKEFPIEMVIQALDFPNTTDRNKALYILSGLANHSEYAIYIKSHARPLLQKHLALMQPNLHELSEDILKKIDAYS